MWKAYSNQSLQYHHVSDNTSSFIHGFWSQNLQWSCLLPKLLDFIKKTKQHIRMSLRWMSIKQSSFFQNHSQTLLPGSAPLPPPHLNKPQTTCQAGQLQSAWSHQHFTCPSCLSVATKNRCLQQAASYLYHRNPLLLQYPPPVLPHPTPTKYTHLSCLQQAV